MTKKSKPLAWNIVPYHTVHQITDIYIMDVSYTTLDIAFPKPGSDKIGSAIFRNRICHIVNIGHVHNIIIQIICRKIMQKT